MSSETTELVTGPDGFIGRHLVPYLDAQGYKVIAASWSPCAEEPNVQNLNLAIRFALTDPRARGETLIMADPTPITVANLIARNRVRLGRRHRLFPIPDSLLKYALTAVGQSAVWHRIGCPLVARPERELALGCKPA